MDVERVLRDALGDADVDATRRVLAGIIEMLGEAPLSRIHTSEVTVAHKTASGSGLSG